MDTTKTIEFQGIALRETTFASAEVGRDYVTAQGYKVTVNDVQPDSHAMIRMAKGKVLRTKADARCDGPIPAGESPTDASACASVPSEAMPARKPWRQMTPEELQDAYRLAVGRETRSGDPGYVAWKVAQARKGRVTVGAIEKRAPATRPLCRPCR